MNETATTPTNATANKSNEWQRKSQMNGLYKKISWALGPRAQQNNEWDSKQINEQDNTNSNEWEQKTMSETVKQTMNETAKNKTMSEPARNAMNEN